MLSAEFYSDDLEACWLPKYSPAELCEAQLADLSLGKLLTWIEADGSPTVAELYLCPPEVKRFWLAKKHLVLQNGVLYYKWEAIIPQYLLIMPKSLQEEVLAGCHDCPTSGHWGQKNTLA